MTHYQRSQVVMIHAFENKELWYFPGFLALLDRFHNVIDTFFKRENRIRNVLRLLLH